MPSARVLFPGVPNEMFMVGRDVHGQVTIMFRDMRGVELVATEMISRGVTSVAMIGYHQEELDKVHALPTLLTKRFRAVDRKGRCQSIALSALSPVRAFYGVKMTHLGVIEGGGDLPPEQIGALFTIHDALHKLALGYRHGLQVELDLAAVRTAVALLRRDVTDTEAAVRLALLEGALGAYGDFELPILVPNPTSIEDRTRLLDDLLRSKDYRGLANSTFDLGNPQRVRNALGEIRRWVETILRSQRFGTLLDYGSAVVNAATGFPLPKSDFFGRLYRSGSLPPIVSLAEERQAAIQCWYRLEVEPVSGGQPTPFPAIDPHRRAVKFERLVESPGTATRETRPNPAMEADAKRRRGSSPGR